MAAGHVDLNPGEPGAQDFRYQRRYGADQPGIVGEKVQIVAQPMTEIKLRKSSASAQNKALQLLGCEQAFQNLGLQRG